MSSSRGSETSAGSSPHRILVEREVMGIGEDPSPSNSSFPSAELNFRLADFPTEREASSSATAVQVTVPNPRKISSRVRKDPVPDIQLPGYYWVKGEVGSYHSRFRTAESIMEMRKSISLSSIQTEEAVIAEPCTEDEHVFMSAQRGQIHFTYMYKTLFESLGVGLPFSEFECAVLRALNVAPTQLHPNSWAFLKAFEVLCRKLNMTPTAPKFLYFYQIRFGNKIGWISLSGMNKKGIIGPYTSSYKDFKGSFFKVRPAEGYSEMFFNEEGRPRFPLYWTRTPIKFQSWCYEDMSASEKADVDKLNKLPRPLNCKILLRLPYSSTPNKDLSLVMGKFNWRSIKNMAPSAGPSTENLQTRPDKEERGHAEIMTTPEVVEITSSPHSPPSKRARLPTTDEEPVSSIRSPLLPSPIRRSPSSIDPNIARFFGSGIQEVGDKEALQRLGPKAVLDSVSAMCLRAATMASLCGEEFEESDRRLKAAKAELLETTNAKDKASSELAEAAKSQAALLLQVEELKKSLADAEVKIQVVEKERDALTTEVAWAKSVEAESSALAANLQKDLEQAKKKQAELEADVQEAVQQIMKEHVEGFHKALRQVHLFLPKIELSAFDVNKDVKDGMLVDEEEL